MGVTTSVFEGRASQVALGVKNLPPNAGDIRDSSSIPRLGTSPGGGGGHIATHSSILAWKIPWIEESGGLQSMGSQRVRHDLATKQELRNSK